VEVAVGDAVGLDVITGERVDTAGWGGEHAVETDRTRNVKMAMGFM